MGAYDGILQKEFEIEFASGETTESGFVVVVLSNPDPSGANRVAEFLVNRLPKSQGQSLAGRQPKTPLSHDIRPSTCRNG